MRSIEKELADYERLIAGKKRADFTASDVIAIHDNSLNANGYVDTSMAIMKALCIGYSVGYRSAQRAK